MKINNSQNSNLKINVKNEQIKLSDSLIYSESNTFNENQYDESEYKQ